MHIRQHVCHMWMSAPSGAWQITDNSSNKVQFWQFISWAIANKKQQQQRGRCQECHNSTQKFNGTPKSKHPLKSKPPKMLWLHPGLWKYDKQNSDGGPMPGMFYPTLPALSPSMALTGTCTSFFLWQLWLVQLGVNCSHLNFSHISITRDVAVTFWGLWFQWVFRFWGFPLNLVNFKLFLCILRLF